MNKYKRLIITANDIAKKVAVACSNREDIVLTVEDIKNRKYKDYIFEEVAVHQYSLVKETFGKEFDKYINELFNYIKNKNFKRNYVSHLD